MRRSELKAIFLGTTRNAAEYWARQWGYRRDEVRTVTFDMPHWFNGLSKDIPIYLCGPTEWELDRIKRADEILRYLQAIGHTIYDAQEMGDEYRMPLPHL